MAFPWMCLAMIILPNLGGWIGGIAVGNNSEWYKTLNNAPIAPPSWVFGPVWTILYCMMGFASYLVWEERKEKSWIPLAAYAVQLILNWLWTWIFFGMHLLLGSLIEIVLLDIAVLVCIVAFAIVRIGAGALLIPYFVWLCLATYLNYYIYANN
ncbi:translocator [Nesidiocoris tenuis]|uniref:Translocator n=1 Tax=Nesidiocoris tenuis TaxID=355587 RepID=A0ABN7AWI5_9HEMI|nr:translocator [Nesidiocoris tenuis]